MSVRRYDTGLALRVDAKNRTPQGFLRCDATIARTGVQAYQQPDGTIRREYRPPEEVFKADALASFELAPMTLLHPPEKVTAENAQKYTVGVIAERPRQDQSLVRTSALVMHADAIRAALSGEAAELSCGYECDLEDTPGEFEGERYDAVQRNIRGNHVALVPKGRAGPAVRLKMDGGLRLDANDAVQVDLPANSKEGSLMAVKIRIDGVECEVSETAAQLVAKQDAKHLEDAKAAKARIDALEAESRAAKAETEKLKARADAAEEATKKAEAARKDAEDPAKLSSRIAARVALETAARKLAPDVKLDGLTDDDVRKAVVAKVHPEVRVDEKSAEYIAARFDVALERLDTQDPIARARAAAVTTPKAGEAGAEQKMDAESARAAMIAENQKRWQAAAAK